MRIFGKLVGATLLAMAITAVVGGLGWLGLDATRTALETLIEVRTPQIQTIDAMIETLHTIRVDEFALVNSRLEPERRAQMLAALDEAQQRLTSDRRRFSLLPLTPRQKDLWKGAETALDQWLPKHRRMIELVADNRVVNVELLPGILAGHLLDYRQWFDELRGAARGGQSFTGELNPMATGLGRWMVTYQTEDPRLQELLAELRNRQDQLHAVAGSVNDLLTDRQPARARILFDQEAAPAFARFQGAMAGIRDYVDAKLTGFDVAINYVFGDVDRAFTAGVAALKAVATEVSRQALVDSERAAATGARSQRVALAATLAGLLLFLGFGLWLARHMTRRLSRAVTFLRELEQGHLDQRLALPGQDEISVMSWAMDAFAEDLQGRVLGVNAAARELIEVSGRIAAASLQVDRAAREQAAGVTVTSASVEEIDASVRQVAGGVEILSEASTSSTSSVLEMSANSEELAGSAESLARIVEGIGSSISEMAASIQQVAANTGVLKDSADATASSVAQMQASLGEVERNIQETALITDGVRSDVETGQTTVERTSSGIEEIRQASRISADAIGTLTEKVQSIDQILAMIDEVTDQTSLLALNAAIIAAQAGEHGRGFAVVAEEIRELSDRVSRSTREISGVIGSVRQETGRVAEAVARVERRVVEGEELSRESGKALAKIVAGVQDIDLRMDQIARATMEQSQGAGAIGSAMERVAQMVDQTVGATREQSGAAGTITAAVEQLRDLTQQVKTSAREQSNGSRVVAAAMAEIDEMVGRINLACGEQTRGSSQIGRAVEAIRASAETNLLSTAALQEAVERQNRQIEVLREEMGAFRVTEAAATPAWSEGGESPAGCRPPEQGRVPRSKPSAGHEIPAPKGRPFPDRGSPAPEAPAEGERPARCVGGDGG